MWRFWEGVDPVWWICVLVALDILVSWWQRRGHFKALMKSFAGLLSALSRVAGYEGEARHAQIVVLSKQLQQVADNVNTMKRWMNEKDPHPPSEGPGPEWPRGQSPH